MSNARQSHYAKTGLVIGRTYTRQKIRIALGKIYPASSVLQEFLGLEKDGTLTRASKNPMSHNLDMFTINKELL